MAPSDRLRQLFPLVLGLLVLASFLCLFVIEVAHWQMLAASCRYDGESHNGSTEHAYGIRRQDGVKLRCDWSEAPHVVSYSMFGLWVFLSWITFSLTCVNLFDYATRGRLPTFTEWPNALTRLLTQDFGPPPRIV